MHAAGVDAVLIALPDTLRQPHSTPCLVWRPNGMASAAVVTRLAAAGAKGGRVYRVAHSAHRPAYLPSVTSILSVLDKAALVPWAVRTSLNVVRQELHTQRALGFEALRDGTEATDRAGVGAAWVEAVLDRAARAPDETKNAAAGLGTRVHAAVDAIIKGVDPGPLDPDVLPAVDGFRSWYARSGMTLSPAGDFTVYSRTYRYAGAADCLGRAADGSVVVLDFKTSNFIHSSYALQLAAYAYAVQEMARGGELDVDAMLAGTAAVVPMEGAGAAEAEAEASAAVEEAAAMTQSREGAVAAAVGGEAAPPSELPPALAGSGGISAPSLAFGGLDGWTVGGPMSMPTSPMATPTPWPSPGAAAAPLSPPPRRAVRAPRSTKAASSALLHGRSPIIDDDFLRSVGGGGRAPLSTQTARGRHGPDGDDLLAGISAVVVRLDKSSGAVEVQRVGDLRRAFDAFKAALMLWHAMQGSLLEPVKP